MRKVKNLAATKATTSRAVQHSATLIAWVQASTAKSGGLVKRSNSLLAESRVALSRAFERLDHRPFR
jgi:hypothetical protein